MIEGKLSLTFPPNLLSWALTNSKGIVWENEEAEAALQKSKRPNQAAATVAFPPVPQAAQWCGG